MRTTRNISFYCLLVLCSIVLVGCSKTETIDATVDENQPISEVQAQAEKMNSDELRTIALKYKDAIKVKSEEMNEITSNLLPSMAKEGITLTDIKEKVDGVVTSLNKLKERFEIYYNKLKEKGGDVSGLE